MKYIPLLCCAILLSLSGFANPTDSIHQFTLELKNNTNQIDFNDRVNLLYYITDSLGDKNDYQVKIKGYCSKDNKLKKASSFAQERADMVRNTMIDNGFFDYQIIACEGLGGPGVDEDKVWLTFFPRTMKPAEIATYEVELARLSKYVMVTDTLLPGDLKPGKIYVFTKITYPKGKRSFDREALPYVMNIATVLAADTTLKAEVRSYLCCPEINSPDGVDADSKKRELTQNRARQLCGFLVKKGGITPTRLKPVAKGAQDLLVRETDDAAKAKNERIELLISR